MVRALRETVRVQPGGKIELTSSDLPEGAKAEVIVLVDGREDVHKLDILGLFADEPDLMDRVVADAMASRGMPLRTPRG